MRIAFATTNAGKVRELRHLFEGLPGAEWVDPEEITAVLAPEETGTTFAENAALKAAAYARALGCLAIADDSGLTVDQLDGRPGLYSARYGATDAERIARLLAELAPLPPPHPAAFVCAMAVASPEGVLLIEEGRLEGEVVREARGKYGFGFDPVFQVSEFGCALAEVPASEKNRLSHRGRAARNVRPHLELWAARGWALPRPLAADGPTSHA